MSQDSNTHKLNNFSIRLKCQLKNAGLSQNDLARLLSTSPTTVSSWTSGRNFPNTNYARKIGEILKIDYNWLLFGSFIKPLSSEKSLNDNINENKDIIDGFSKRLKFLIDQSKLTQTALSIKLNTKPSTVHSWIKGYNLPKLSYLNKVSELFKVDPNWLLFGEFTQNKKIKENFEKSESSDEDNSTDFKADILPPLIRKFHPVRSEMICDWIKKNKFDETVFLFELFNSLAKYIGYYGNHEPDVVFTPKKSASESYAKMIEEVSDRVLFKAKMATVEKNKNKVTNPETKNA